MLLIFSCGSSDKQHQHSEAVNSASSKIKVLNVGTFHFGYSSDAHTTEFDEKSESAQKEVRQIAEMMARFKPTIVCVESVPEKHVALNTLYREFLKNPATLITELGETSMLAFEVARLNGIDSIYGIDNHMGYNYSVGDFIENSPDLENSIDPETYLELTNHPFKDYPELAEKEKHFDDLPLPEKFRLMNDPRYLDNSIISNADKLLYVGIGDEFQGAENAAIFYNRNMRIFSNLNRIKMSKEDRVFILMGSAHTAFLREFIERSPKFEMVNTLEYLRD
ncbi:hypothetical protein GCM10011506_00750 [Marivirga lumbricoides]|uniref:Uncharacterized protein n=2 Tax=Marivirga lumbricoides TaxID=1046115 RepID=A0ABQ1L4U8_9BACT|nr:hypothetical protein GCM10011506_00750 [Marivirga lumbricoides]